MGRLIGFRYRQIVKRLRKLGFELDRQAAGSHEIRYNPTNHRYTTIPSHPGDMPEGTRGGIFRGPLEPALSGQDGPVCQPYRLSLSTPRLFTAPAPAAGEAAASWPGGRTP